MNTLASFQQLLEDTMPMLDDPAPNHRIPGDPWINLMLTCERCDEDWGETQRAGTKGTVCPFCGDSDKDFVWE